MKLQFEDNEYYLVDEHYDTIASTDSVMRKACEDVKKLSKQNCDEIFGVVDVEKLAESHAEECYERNGDPLEESYFENRKYNFKNGFNKAMELKKDKLFTKEQVVEFTMRMISQYTQGNTNIWNRELLSESLLQQPKEIEVEIRCYVDYPNDELDSFNSPFITNTGVPKLDENGCLILKKK